MMLTSCRHFDVHAAPRVKRIVVVCWALMLGWGCAYQPGSLENPERGLNFIPQSMEIQMGLQAAQEIETQVNIVNDATLQHYLNQLGQTLAHTSRRPDIAYQFKVVDDADINAFALPGGFVYVHTGLIRAAHNEAELAGVIGHEIGHVVARHGAKQMSQLILWQLGFATFWALSDQERDDQMKLLVADAVATGFLLKNSRDAERQADDLGTENLYQAGYEPIALAQFFDTLSAEHDPSALETFFSTHPSPGERAQNVANLIATFPPKSYITDTVEFQQIKQRLSVATPAATPGQPAGFRQQRLRQKPIGAPRRQ